MMFYGYLLQARPTMYQVVKEMVDKMGYEVRLVRVTKRVHEAYFAQLFLSKVCNWSLIYNLHSALET